MSCTPQFFYGRLLDLQGPLILQFYRRTVCLPLNTLVSCCSRPSMAVVMFLFGKEACRSSGVVPCGGGGWGNAGGNVLTPCCFFYFFVPFFCLLSKMCSFDLLPLDGAGDLSNYTLILVIIAMFSIWMLPIFMLLLLNHCSRVLKKPTLMSPLTILSWNVRSLNSKIKRCLVLNLLEKYNPHVCILQENHFIII